MSANLPVLQHSPRQFGSKLSRIALALAAVVSSHTIAAETSDAALVLNDGGFLRGQLSLLESDGSVTWKHSVTGQSIEFPSGSYGDILFHALTSPSVENDLVRLHDGSLVVGTVTSLTGEKLLLKSPKLGQISLDRALINSIRLRNHASKSKLVSGGTAMSVENWQGSHQNENRPRQAAAVRDVDDRIVIDGAYYPNLNKDVPLPDQFVLSLTLDWKDHLDFRMSVGSGEEGRAVKHSHIHAIFTSRMYRVQMVNPQGRSNQSPRTMIDTTFDDEATRGTKVVEIFVDRPLKRVVMVVDGEMIGDYSGTAIAPQIIENTESNSFCGGGWVTLQQRGSGAVRVSGFTVRKWDGRSLSFLSDQKEKRTTDLMSFVDGDQQPVTIDKITKFSGGSRMVHITKPGGDEGEGTSIVDESFIGCLMFASDEGDETLDHPAARYRLHLTDGSTVTANSLSRSSSGGNFSVSLTYGRKVSLPRSAIARIQSVDLPSEDPPAGDSD